MSCKIKLGFCAVFWLMIIYALDVCNAKCDQYFIVFEENPCPIYRLSPLKKRDINWDKVSYPCNSTDNHSINKECIIEFECLGTTLTCQKHIKVENHQTHSLIEDNRPAKLIESRIKPLDEPKINITGKETPNHTTKEGFNTSMYDINLIYAYEDEIQIKNNSETTNNKSKLKDQIIRCDYAETICVDEGNPENNSLSDIINETLQISINRDETSPVQPIFTGYFPQSSNNSDSEKFNCNFTNFKTANLECKFKDKNCKQNTHNNNTKLINIYIKTNYIQNNTITKYLNCTKDTIATEKKFKVKCEDILFTKHNQHILLTTPPKPELKTWTCHITESDSLSNKEKQSKIFFKNCFNAANPAANKNKYVNNTVTPTSGNENKTTYDISTKDDNVMHKTEYSIEKKGTKEDNLTLINPENVITILITEKVKSCSHKSSLNIHEGKIIDLGLNNDKENNLRNNNIELVLSNCININSSGINSEQPHSKAELTIILKNESLNTSILKQFNDTPIETSFKERILLRCDYPQRDLSNNTASNKTILQCESIDLDYYNITGVEIKTNLNPTSNNKSELKSKNKIEQDVLPWNCNILEVNNTVSGKDQHSEKNKLYFSNCTNDVNINNSKSKSGDITPISDGKPIITNKTKDAIKINKTEISNEKLGFNKDNLSRTKPEKMINILVTAKVNNCSHESSLNIHEGKIIDLDINNNKNKILQNNDVELILSNCINVNHPNINETQLQLKAELIIILKNKSLNTLNLKLFNGTSEEENVKQRILLRCDKIYSNSSSYITSNKTLLKCEFIDLDLYNITGIEIDTNLSPISNTNNAKEQKKDVVNIVKEEKNKTKEVNAEVNKNSNINTNKSVESHESKVNNKRPNNTIIEVVNKKVPDNISEKKEESKTLIFNRRKDMPDGAGANSLALGNTEPEKIMLITLLTIAGVSILIMIALRICPKKSQYNIAPTREPPDNEETAF